MSPAARLAFSPLFVGVEVAGTGTRPPRKNLSTLSVPYSSGSRLLAPTHPTRPPGPLSLSDPYSSGSRLLEYLADFESRNTYSLSVPYSSGSRLLGCSVPTHPGSPPTFSPLFVGVEVAGALRRKVQDWEENFQSPIRRGRGCWRPWPAVSTSVTSPLSVPYSSGSRLLACAG